MIENEGQDKDGPWLTVVGWTLRSGDLLPIAVRPSRGGACILTSPVVVERPCAYSDVNHVEVSGQVETLAL